MIYLTGDIHGDVTRLEAAALQRRGIAIRKEDTILVCGDFEIPWGDGKRAEDEARLARLSRLPYRVLFIDGNHENYTLLKKYPVSTFAGARVQRLLPNVMHVLRGEILTLEGQTFFCLGGAASTDRNHLTQGLSWWPEEEISPDEKRRALENAAQAKWHVDYVVTHTAPQAWKEKAFGSVPGDDCETARFLDILAGRLHYQRWFFGHFHWDHYTKESRAAWLFSDVVTPDLGRCGTLPAEYVRQQLPDTLRMLAEAEETDREKLHQAIVKVNREEKIPLEIAMWLYRRFDICRPKNFLEDV